MDYKSFGRLAVQYGVGAVANSIINRFKPRVNTNNKMGMILRKRSRTSTAVRTRSKKKSRRGGGMMSSVLGPNIPAPLPVAKHGKFALYGSYGQDETYGTITQPEMAYFGFTSAKCTGHSGVNLANESFSGSIMYHVAAALLRSILKREFGEDICRHDQLVSGKVSTWNRFPSIIFVAKTTPLTTSVATFPHQIQIALGSGSNDVSNPRMFGDIALEIQSQVLGNQNFGGTADNLSCFTHSLYGYYILTPDGADNQVNGRASAIRRLDNQYLVAYSTAEIALQNVTVADATTDTSGIRLGDRIDSNPLDCAIYKFKTPYPKVREDGIAVSWTGTFPNPTVPIPMFNVAGVAVGTSPDNSFRLQHDSNGDGMIIPNVSLSRDWKQIPSPARFEGCTAHTRFKMDPGMIRKGILQFKFEGTINNLIKGFRTISDTDATRLNTKESFGTSMLFAVEKVMSTGSDTNVTVNYQLSYYAGAYMKRMKKNVMQSYNTTGTYVPPVAIGNTIGTYTAGTYTGAADT